VVVQRATWTQDIKFVGSIQ